MHINKHYLKKQNKDFNLIFYCFFLSTSQIFTFIFFIFLWSFHNTCIEFPDPITLLGLSCLLYPVSSLYLNLFFSDSFSVLFLFNPSALIFQKVHTDIPTCVFPKWLSLSHHIHWAGHHHFP